MSGVVRIFVCAVRVLDHMTVEEVRNSYSEISRRPLVVKDRIEFHMEDDGRTHGLVSEAHPAQVCACFE